MDEKEKLAEMAEEKPRKALIYGMGIVIVILAGVCSTLFFKLEAAKDDKIAALVVQEKEHREVVAVKDKVIQDLNTLVITRTDVSADQWARHYQSLLEKMEKQNVRRNRIAQEQTYLRKKDASNIKELEEKQPDEKDGN
jgi:hypothetical protein